MRLRTLTALGCLLAGLALGGCGSKAVTKQQVVVRAEAICESTLASVRASQPAVGAVKAVLPAIEHEVKQLAALPRPAQDRAILNGYIAAMRGALGDWRRLGAAQGKRGTGAAASVALAALQVNRAPGLARRYGLRDCAAAGATVGSASGAA